MTSCPLYNNSNLAYTGPYNPYALIQNAGRKRKTSKKTGKKLNKKTKSMKSRNIKLRKSLRRSRGYIY
jgi:hypothetical protein